MNLNNKEHLWKLQLDLGKFRFLLPTTAQKMKFFIKDFFNECDEISRFLQIWSHLLKKSLMENFNLYAMDHLSTTCCFCISLFCFASLSHFMPLVPIPPENILKLLVTWYFQGVQKETNGIKSFNYLGTINRTQDSKIQGHLMIYI